MSGDDLWSRVERYFAQQAERLKIDAAVIAEFGPMLSPAMADLVATVGPSAAVRGPDGLRVLAALFRAYAMAAEEDARELAASLAAESSSD